MKLEDLKNTWQNADHHIENQDKIEIEKFLSKKPTTIFTKIRRNIIIETFINIIFMAGLPFIPLRLTGNGEIFFWINYGMVAVIYVGLMIKIRKIFKKVIVSNTLLETIIKTKDLYEKYIRIYKNVSYFMVFLGLLLGLIFRFYKEETHLSHFEFADTENILYFILGIIGFGILMFFAVKYYIYLVYEKHLIKLKKNLNELINIEK
ncbi:hypothetical protein [Aureivirga sp. CE67]|uniref:hypothetical protein n=1 Tax=Aureivirga sp. CE67 TaxID=1788983 RepID=UPI0018CA648D|nr:hypothetical protein [Aureivirga sp. CE67]